MDVTHGYRKSKDRDDDKEGSGSLKCSTIIVGLDEKVLEMGFGTDVRF